MSFAVVTWARFFSDRLRPWRELPVVEFAAWLLLMLIAITGLLFGESRAQAADDLETALSFPQMLAIPFWILLGIEAVDAAINLAQRIVRKANRLIPAGWFSTLVILVLVARPVVSFALILNDGGGVGWTF